MPTKCDYIDPDSGKACGPLADYETLYEQLDGHWLCTFHNIIAETIGFSGHFGCTRNGQRHQAASLGEPAQHKQLSLF